MRSWGERVLEWRDEKRRGKRKAGRKYFIGPGNSLAHQTNPTSPILSASSLSSSPNSLPPTLLFTSSTSSPLPSLPCLPFLRLEGEEGGEEGRGEMGGGGEEGGGGGGGGGGGRRTVEGSAKIPRSLFGVTLFSVYLVKKNKGEKEQRVNN